MAAARRGALAVAAVVTAVGLTVLVGTRWIEGQADYAGVGARAFPALIGGALALSGMAFGLGVWRGREPLPEAEPSNRVAFAWIAGALALAVVLVQPLGFAIAAALVFAMTARGFGSRRAVRDAVVGLALGVAIHAIFARGLGVSLPGGPFA